MQVQLQCARIYSGPFHTNGVGVNNSGRLRPGEAVSHTPLSLLALLGRSGGIPAFLHIFLQRLKEDMEEIPIEPVDKLQALEPAVIPPPDHEFRIKHFPMDSLLLEVPCKFSICPHTQPNTFCYS